ncbi:MAG: choice-of-anchor J domain-containing protein [Bacteroidales bacterium]
MKKLLYFTAMIGLLWACNPMEDTYDKLDEALEPYHENISYALVAKDYTTAGNAALVDATNADDSSKAKLIISQLAFNERFSGADYIAPVLSKNFPALNKGSVAAVTYTTSHNTPSYLSDLSTNNILSTSDYQQVWGNDILYVSAFTPAKSPSANLPTLLTSKFPSATSGTYKLVEYNYSSTEATTDIVDFKYFYDDFESHTCATLSPYTPISENGWVQIDTAGTKGIYYCRLYSSNKYAQITSNATNEKNDAFLITPQIDLSSATAPKFSFNINVGYWNADCLTVLISSNFDGDVNHIAQATWVDLTSNFTLPQTPTSGYGTLASAGEANLSAYAGSKVYIVFKYTGDSRTTTSPKITTTYQIDNVKVSEMMTSLSIPSSEKQWTIYTLDGSTWKPAESSFVALQQDDYTSMGLSYISSANAPLYIPNYLSQTFPYALEGDIKNVAYKSSSTQTYSRATQYTLTNGIWVINTFVTTSTDQFIHTGEKWIFDPTVHLSPSSSDLQLLVDYVYTNLSRSYGSNYGNDEFYYGASAYYKNFDLRLTNKVTYSIPGFAELTTEEEKIALTWTRLQEGLIIMLQLKYTEAVPDISGVPVYYYVTFATYENNLAKNTYVGIFRCTTAGPNPVFIRDTALEDEAVEKGELTAEQVAWNR